jgi:Uma2 family endonuclease
MENRLYYPDVSVSCDPADWTRKKALEAPGVVVEVTSPSTEKTDKTEKLAAYQSYTTIQEILFVDSRRRHVEHYHRVGMYKWEEFLYEHEARLYPIEVETTSLRAWQCIIVQEFFRYRAEKATYKKFEMA